MAGSHDDLVLCICSITGLWSWLLQGEKRTV